jgi:hypothetical protein
MTQREDPEARDPNNQPADDHPVVLVRDGREVRFKRLDRKFGFNDVEILDTDELDDEGETATRGGEESDTTKPLSGVTMQITISDEMFCEIGRITIYQTHIEYELAFFIQELLRIGNDDRGDIITVKLAFKELIRVAGSLLRSEFGDDHEQVRRFNEFKSEAIVLFDRRNQLAHSLWTFGKDLVRNTATRIKTTEKQHSVKKVAEFLSLDDLKDISEKMHNVLWLLSDIRVRICHYEVTARRF